jgi:hypothetical protein
MSLCQAVRAEFLASTREGDPGVEFARFGCFVRNGDYSLKWIAATKYAQWHSFLDPAAFIGANGPATAQAAVFHVLGRSKPFSLLVLRQNQNHECATPWPTFFSCHILRSPFWQRKKISVGLMLRK